MNQRGGFSYTDYDVMDRSCNTFTYELSKRLNLAEKYPIGILNQSKMGEFLAPVVHAIDILAAAAGFSNTSKRYLGCQSDPSTPNCIRKSLEKPDFERYFFYKYSHKTYSQYVKRILKKNCKNFSS